MDNSSTVAVVRTDRRRGGVAEALALIVHDLVGRIQDDRNPVIIPTLDNPARADCCTHRDTLSATVDALLGAGASSITIAGRGGGRHVGHDDFTRLGFRQELWNRPVRFVDIDDGGETYGTVRWISPRGLPRSLRLPSSVFASRCRVVLGTARTHDVFRVGLGLANLTSIVHRDDQGLLGLSRHAGELPPPWLDLANGMIRSWRGAVRSAWLGMRTIAGGMRLTGPERRRLEAVERATSCLVALAAFALPRISLIDAFHASEGEGPRHGRRVPLRTIIAGTDAVAVDAVAAAVLGFEPVEIAYLRLAQATGLGKADLSAITIVGDPIARPRRLRRHSADRLLRLAGAGSAHPALPHPHFGPSVVNRPTPSATARQSDAHRL
ncbi:MAG: DUF362 domain-containing protein [Isosphaeraceae bacterium]